MSSDRPSWQIIIDRDARRSLRRLPKPLEARIRSAISGLASEPRPPSCVKLVGFTNLWRIRVGDWRIVYVIEDDQLIIVVVEIGPRGSAYRNLS
jgi:mRNA interferase RelE/StbE